MNNEQHGLFEYLTVVSMHLYIHWLDFKFIDSFVKSSDLLKIIKIYLRSFECFVCTFVTRFTLISYLFVLTHQILEEKNSYRPTLLPEENKMKVHKYIHIQITNLNDMLIDLPASSVSVSIWRAAEPSTTLCHPSPAAPATS